MKLKLMILLVLIAIERIESENVTLDINAQPKIVGGSEAIPGQVPSLVRLTYTYTIL